MRESSNATSKGLSAVTGTESTIAMKHNQDTALDQENKWNHQK